MANRLPEMRKKRNLTQMELAAKSGVCRSIIARFETGKQGISARNLERICKVLKCKMEDVLQEAS